jgi:hypothetical protein
MAGALYDNVITEPEYTVDVRVRSTIVSPITSNAVTGFETPSTCTSKLVSAGGFVESVLSPMTIEILPLM